MAPASIVTPPPTEVPFWIAPVVASAPETTSREPPADMLIPPVDAVSASRRVPPLTVVVPVWETVPP